MNDVLMGYVLGAFSGVFISVFMLSIFIGRTNK